MNEENFFIVFMIVLICSVLFLGYLADSYQCHSKAHFQGLEADYGIATGCMVKVDDKWMDYKRLRYIDD